MPRQPPRPRSFKAKSRFGPGTLVVSSVLIVIVGALGLIRFQRSRAETTTLSRAATLFPNPIEPLPELDAERFLLEQHRRCFAENYAGAWFRKRLEERPYLECMNTAYAEQLRGVAVLEDPALGVHENPSFTALEYTVRVVSGKLPESMTEATRRDCGVPGSYGFSTTPASERGFEEISNGVYRVQTLEGLDGVPCRLRLTLLYRDWPLSEPLEVDLPAWDPDAKEAQNESHRLYRQGLDSVLACVRGAAAGLPRSGWGELTAELEGRVQVLQASSDTSRALDAIRELKQMGSSARPAVPAIVDALASGRAVEVAASEAVAGIAPDVPELASVVQCLLDHPNPSVGAAAAVSLSQMGDPRSVDALDEILTTASEQTKLSTLLALLATRSELKATVPAVVKCALSDPSAAVRERALMVLPTLDADSPKVEETLRRALDDPEPAVRAQAESSLRTLPGLRAR